MNWESPHVHPLELTPNGTRLLAINTPDARLEVFDTTGPRLVKLHDVPVGLDPVSVRARTNDEVRVVNHVSDSVSVISLSTANVIATFKTDDEPADVVFAGSPQRAFVSCSQVNTIQVFDFGAAPDGTLDVAVIDATAQVRAEAELARQRTTLATTASMLELVVNQMTAIYWIVDRDLRIVEAGGAVAALFRRPPSWFLGRPIGELRGFEPGSDDPAAMHRRAIAGETVRYAAEWRRKHLLTTVCPHRHDGVIVGAIGTCIDVTVHRALEARMVEAQRAEALGVLAGGVAHDLNNLLAAILGNVELAQRALPAGAERAPLDNIQQASLRAGELLEQLLANAGPATPAPIRLSARRIVDDLIRISSVTWTTAVRVEVDVGRDLVLRGAAAQLRQVLLNLLGNAREALGARGGRISIHGGYRRVDGAADPDDVITAPAGSYVVLAVADDGPGIAREVRRRMFEPFFTTKATGHGLGLAAVAGILRAAGGGLRVRWGETLVIRFDGAYSPTEHTPGFYVDIGHVF